MQSEPRTSLKAVRLSAVEAKILEDSARKHNMSASDILRAGLVLWRERHGDRAEALEQWARTLIKDHGEGAVLVATLTGEFDVDVRINDQPVATMHRSAVFDGANTVQIWIGDEHSDARAFLGRLPVAAGAVIGMPVAAVASLGASDVDEV